MKKIVWIDDDIQEYQRFVTALPAQHKIEIEFIPLDSQSEFGFDPEQILERKADIVLLDWNEGQSEEGLQYLYKKNQACIVVSWSKLQELQRSDLFGEVNKHRIGFLQKGFLYTDLLSKMEELQKSLYEELRERVSTVGGEWIASWGGEEKKEKSILDLFAVRFFDEAFNILAVSPAWTAGPARPRLEFTEQDKRALENGVRVTHNIFAIYPNDADRFGPLQFFTERLKGGKYRDFPENAVYLQKAFPLTEDAMVYNNFGGSVSGIISLMRQAGFKRGRFYHLAHVPGLSNPSLELVARYPEEPDLAPLPASIEADQDEMLHLKKYCDQYDAAIKSGSRSLIYALTESHGAGNNNSFWNQYVKNEAIEQRLEVPVFLDKTERQQADKQFEKMRGVFVFDTGEKGKITDKRVGYLSKTLLVAINYFEKSRKKEHAYREQQVALHMMDLYKQLAALNSKEELAEALINAVVKVESFEAQGEANSETAAARSATFSSYNPKNKLLKVICETNKLMKGMEFPLGNNFFVMVRCANNSLAGKKQPEFQPNFDVSEEKMCERLQHFSQLKQCQEEPGLAERCVEHIRENVRAVVAFPVLSGGELIGVLALRSNRAHEFTLRRVRIVENIIEIAAPYLQRFKMEAQRRNALDSLVMHEMRSNLSWALGKLDRIYHANGKEERIKAANDLSFILQDGHALSSMFLQWLGSSELQGSAPTDDEFWLELDQYGKFRESSSENLRWKFQYNPACVGQDKVQLGRAIRILIDNAFRYADGEDTEISCEIDFYEKTDLLKVVIRNPGTLLNTNGRATILTPEDFANTHRRNLKPKIGLSLVHMLCEKIGGNGPTLKQDEIKPSTVIAEIYWPLFMN